MLKHIVLLSIFSCCLVMGFCAVIHSDQAQYLSGMVASNISGQRKPDEFENYGEERARLIARLSFGKDGRYGLHGNVDISNNKISAEGAFLNRGRVKGSAAISTEFSRNRKAYDSYEAEPYHSYEAGPYDSYEANREPLREIGLTNHHYGTDYSHPQHDHWKEESKDKSLSHRSQSHREYPQHDGPHNSLHKSMDEERTLHLQCSDKFNPITHTATSDQPEKNKDKDDHQSLVTGKNQPDDSDHKDTDDVGSDNYRLESLSNDSEMFAQKAM